MSAKLTRFHLDYVSHHLNQTLLVEFLLAVPEAIYPEDLEGSEPETEIYQWLAFPNFRGYDLERLTEAKIPVIDSEYGAWVGITSFGSHYDLYVYPELILALFDIDCSYGDIEQIRRL